MDMVVFWVITMVIFCAGILLGTAIATYLLGKEHAEEFAIHAANYKDALAARYTEAHHAGFLAGSKLPSRYIDGGIAGEVKDDSS